MVVPFCGLISQDIELGILLFYSDCYYDGNINTLRTAVVNRTSDKHVGKCADFCANENYTRFALQVSVK